MLAIKLSKAGYGTAEQILAMEAEIVIYMIEYESFTSDYQRAFTEINRESK